jgi:general secretion pathway protein B
MSFILDALRKSDAERQRGAAPGLADVRYATGRGRRSLWMPLLAVVLVANIGFMAWQWYAGSSVIGPVVPVETAAPPATPAVPAAPPSPELAVRALAREAESGQPAMPPEVESDLPDTRPATQISAPPAAAVAPPVVAKPPAVPSRIIADPGLPTVEQLIAAGTLNLPLLNLDLLVYNDTPSVRFAVINGRKYREGAQLSEGPTLESITPDGIILASQGQRFTLDRK